jgi:hypothetical protein
MAEDSDRKKNVVSPEDRPAYVRTILMIAERDLQRAGDLSAINEVEFRRILELFKRSVSLDSQYACERINDIARSIHSTRPLLARECWEFTANNNSSTGNYNLAVSFENDDPVRAYQYLQRAQQGGIDVSFSSMDLFRRRSNHIQNPLTPPGVFNRISAVIVGSVVNVAVFAMIGFATPVVNSVNMMLNDRTTSPVTKALTSIFVVPGALFFSMFGGVVGALFGLYRGILSGATGGWRGIGRDIEGSVGFIKSVALAKPTDVAVNSDEFREDAQAEQRLQTKNNLIATAPLVSSSIAAVNLAGIQPGIDVKRDPRNVLPHEMKSEKEAQPLTTAVVRNAPSPDNDAASPAPPAGASSLNRNRR